MTEELLSEFFPSIEAWTLVPSKGGVFEVEIDGELAYSKKATGRHAELDEIRAALRAHAGD